MDSGNVLQSVPDAKIPGSRSGFDLLVIYQRDSQRVRHLLLCPVHGHSRLFQVCSHNCLHGICRGGEWRGGRGLNPRGRGPCGHHIISPIGFRIRCHRPLGHRPEFLRTACALTPRATAFRQARVSGLRMLRMSSALSLALLSAALARATCRSHPGGPPLPLRVSSGSGSAPGGLSGAKSVEPSAGIEPA